MLGAASGVVGTGYGVATYYQTRSQKKDMQKRIEDLEMGIVGGEDNAGTETESRAEPDGRDAEASNTQNDHNDQRRPLPGPDYVWTGMR